MRHRSTWKCLAASAVILPLAVASFGYAPAVRAATERLGATGDASEASPGGSATWLDHTELATLDPARQRISPGFGANILVAIYDQLIRVDADGSIEPRLATSVETTDGSVWTIELRPDVQFSDGTPFDADAVKFNWERIADPATASLNAAMASTISAIEVVDPLTLEVTLSEPNAQWHRYLMTGLGLIASPTALQEMGDEEFASNPVGAGPFVLQEWVRDDHTTLVRNPSYWDQPRPYLDEIVFRGIRQQDQRFDSFAAGEGDFVSAGNPTRQAAEMVADGQQIVIPPLSGGVGVVFNTSRPPLDDVRVRQALVAATDPADFSEKATQGSAQPVETLFASSSPFHVATATQGTDDLARAQALIDEYIAENGGPVRMTFSVSETITLWAEVLQQQWARVDGLEVQVEPVVGSEAQRRLAGSEFDLTTNAISGVDPEPAFFDALYSGSSQNFGMFSDPAMDEALLAGRTALTEQERVEAYAAAQAQFVEQAPYVLLSQPGYSFAATDEIGGFTVYDEGWVDLSAAWLVS